LHIDIRRNNTGEVEKKERRIGATRAAALWKEGAMEKIVNERRNPLRRHRRHQNMEPHKD